MVRCNAKQMRPILLFLLCLPREDPIKINNKGLLNKGVMFWYRLPKEKQERAENIHSKTTIHIPKKQILTVASLDKLFSLNGKGEL